MNSQHHDAQCVRCRDGLEWPDIRAQYASMIDNSGWAIVGVIDRDPPYAYTLGLSLRGLPELCAVGLDPAQEAGMMLHYSAGLLRDGTPVEHIGAAMAADAGMTDDECPFELHQVDYSWLRSPVFAHAQKYWLANRAPETWHSWCTRTKMAGCRGTADTTGRRKAGCCRGANREHPHFNGSGKRGSTQPGRLVDVRAKSQRINNMCESCLHLYPSQGEMGTVEEASANPEVRKLAAAIFEFFITDPTLETGGPLHIYLEDQNSTDEDLEFCRRQVESETWGNVPPPLRLRAQRMAEIILKLSKPLTPLQRALGVCIAADNTTRYFRQSDGKA